MNAERGSRSSYEKARVGLLKAAVIVVMTALPLIILPAYRAPMASIGLFALPILPTALVYSMGIRRETIAWIGSLTILGLATSSWLWYLSSAPDNALALGGPFSAYLLCLSVALIAAGVDKVLTTRARRH